MRVLAHELCGFFCDFIAAWPVKRFGFRIGRSGNFQSEFIGPDSYSAHQFIDSEHMGLDPCNEFESVLPQQQVTRLLFGFGGGNYNFQRVCELQVPKEYPAPG